MDAVEKPGRARWRDAVSGALLFSMFGLCAELVFTGLWSGWSGSFLAHVSLLMVPVYSAAYLLAGPLLGALDRMGWHSDARRVPVTVALIYAIEWTSGAFYRWLGFNPWYYDHGWASAFSGGNITLYWLPAWIVFAFIVVRVYRVVHAVTPDVALALRREFVRQRPADVSLLDALPDALFVRLVGLADTVSDAAGDRTPAVIRRFRLRAREESTERRVGAFVEYRQTHPDGDHDQPDPEDLGHDGASSAPEESIGRTAPGR